MTEVYVAVGGNVDPLKFLSRALALLEKEFGPLRASPAYRNAAVGFEGAEFVNLVVGFETSLPVSEVRMRLQSIEALCERPPDAPKWAPRTMDLDILLYGDFVSDTPGLVFPRPDLVRRPYMLKPMADLAPDRVHPTLGKTMSELWQAFESDHEMVDLGEWRTAVGGR
ncbi:MAG: 2-amino-4-hydroxy-6-hydroxymethyldihydropteridine diphosphokinase [Steroidobacter sp.]